ncbi:penicillin-binding protein [Spirochaetia bacterium]|nr:penicillin-binding protein [Spirochaetia bacterium]
MNIVVKIISRILAGVIVVIAVGIGAGLGFVLSETVNIENSENFQEFAPALPTKILDINGTLITEFSADEKREMVSLSELPRHLIYAVLAREDPDFYSHKGFSIRGIARAFMGRLIGRNLGGGSTITQQVAGTLYTNRLEYTFSRKIRELWWAFQMERRYTKNEILEIYLNYMYMGPGTYGVEAASKYFFGHSAKEISLAEAALLVIQLSSPVRYNPLDNPNTARERQLYVLDKMIALGYATQAEVNASFNEYWDNYDYTRASIGAYYSREDSAPWFSEYVRRELESEMYGTMDYNRDGFTVHTTLNLNHQRTAEKLMAAGIAQANKDFSGGQEKRLDRAENAFIPVVDMLSLFFGFNTLHQAVISQKEHQAISHYVKTLNPVIDMASLAFGIGDLKKDVEAGYGMLKTSTEQNRVEGALISIENETGYITAIVGGSKYDESNQLIRATQSRVMPGSSFKPLYYSAAIDSKVFTPSSLIYDIPMVFHNEDGTPYIPLNFKGEWKGSVLLYYALAHSMNVPSLKVLDGIGFDAAINRAADLLDIHDPDAIRRTFPRVYPLGLGIISVSPLQMARAFAVFGNQGREVSPIAIRSVEDRNGRIVLDLERSLRLKQQSKGAGIQVISQQNAYVMTSILKKTVEIGTLYYGSGWLSKFTFVGEDGKKFRMPAAGKTGTTQNWSDAWAVGYTPYYTSALWFGFDKPGNSLGLSLTGATLAGPIWGDYMRDIHQGLPLKDFSRPSSGIIDVSVCAASGLLRTDACNEGEVRLPFLEGTQPTEYCDQHGQQNFATNLNFESARFNTFVLDEDKLLGNLKLPTLNLDLYPSDPNSRDGTGAASRPVNYVDPNRRSLLDNDYFSSARNNPPRRRDPKLAPLEETWVPWTPSASTNADDLYVNDAADTGKIDDLDDLEAVGSPFESEDVYEPNEDPGALLNLPRYNPFLD